MKILIVDDDENFTQILSTAVTREGFTAIVSKTGRDGLNKAKTESPNLILLDQVLPDISGNQILKELKVADETKNIPVMMISNFSQEDLVNQAINDGATDYIFKYHADTLDIINKIKSALKSGPQTG